MMHSSKSHTSSCGYSRGTATDTPCQWAMTAACLLSGACRSLFPYHFVCFFLCVSYIYSTKSILRTHWTHIYMILVEFYCCMNMPYSSTYVLHRPVHLHDPVPSIESADQSISCTAVQSVPGTGQVRSTRYFEVRSPIICLYMQQVSHGTIPGTSGACLSFTGGSTACTSYCCAAVIEILWC